MTIALAQSAADASLICVYNNRDEFDAFVRSAEAQSACLELVGIDNTCHRFCSAAAALNFGASEATSGILIFAHQDIEFTDSNFILRFISSIKHQNGICGVAGSLSPMPNSYIVSSIMENRGERLFVHETLHEPEKEVFTLDECLFGCSKDVWDTIRFDEDVLDGWHFYAVDFCLHARLLGIHSYVVQSGVWHKSSGNFDDTFLEHESRLARKYSGYYLMVATTCTWFPTGLLYGPWATMRRLKRGITGMMANAQHKLSSV